MEQNQKLLTTKSSFSFSNKSSLHRFDQLKDSTTARKDIKKLVFKAIDQVAEQLKRIPKVQHNSAEIIDLNSEQMNAFSPHVVDQLENRQYYETEAKKIQTIFPTITKCERETKKECTKSKKCKKSFYPYKTSTEVELNDAFIGLDTVIACRHRIRHVREFLKPNLELQSKHMVDNNRNLTEDPNQNVIVMRNTGSEVTGIQFDLRLKSKKSSEKTIVVSITIPDLDELIEEIRI